MAARWQLQAWGFGVVTDIAEHPNKNRRDASGHGSKTHQNTRCPCAILNMGPTNDNLDDVIRSDVDIEAVLMFAIAELVVAKKAFSRPLSRV